MIFYSIAKARFLYSYRLFDVLHTQIKEGDLLGSDLPKKYRLWRLGLLNMFFSM